VLRLRNKRLPLMHLKEAFEDRRRFFFRPRERLYRGHAKWAARLLASWSNGVFHTEEIVVKPMSTKLRHIDMFSGNTILGDGAVIMIH